MQHANVKFGTVLCLLAMAGIGLVAYVWWGDSWITIVPLTIGSICLLSILYAWRMARRVDRLLENPGAPKRDKPVQPEESARNSQDSEK